MMSKENLAKEHLFIFLCKDELFLSLTIKMCLCHPVGCCLTSVSLTFLSLSLSFSPICSSAISAPRLPRPHGVLWVPAALWCPGSTSLKETWPPLHRHRWEEGEFLSGLGLKTDSTTHQQTRPHYVPTDGITLFYYYDAPGAERLCAVSVCNFL